MPLPTAIPRRSHGHRRSAVVPVRMTVADRDAILLFAIRHGSTLSALLATLGNQVARGGGDQVAVLSEPAPVFRELAHQLSRIGSNLRQLALAAQAGISLDSTAEDLEELRVQVATLRKEIKPWVR